MKNSPKNIIPNDVDSYLATVPEPAKSTLEKLRQTIRGIVPAAEEVISYGMPAFKYKGILVYFASFKNHCSFFPGSAIIENFKEELKAYKTSKGTIQFAFDKPLPASLVKKIVKARMKENEEKERNRLMKKENRG
ncbi:MAG: DUF1801 domain-containing protein [Bacteroidetes bacterium]|nr:DUF1801 domain-containing protein [Bacteroidota bacterium]